MLLLDGYYRTLVGFIVLIEKEWISFGHKFADRGGFADGVTDGWKDEERSPIFGLFLDCVHQCLVQMPDSFEFNQRLLVFLMEYAQCGWFPNFMFNSQRELREHLNESSFQQQQPSAISIWAVVLANMDVFTNKSFVAPSLCASPRPSFSGEANAQNSTVVPLQIVASKNRLVFWSEWFLRWNDKLWSASWLEGLTSQIGNVLQQNTSRKHGHSVNNVQHGSSMALSVVKGVIPWRSLGSEQYIVKWVDDKAVSSCALCNRSFSFFWRRHHCRCCGLIFCENCTKYLRIIQSISTWRPCRCCADCARIIDFTEGNSSKSNSQKLLADDGDDDRYIGWSVRWQQNLRICNIADN